MKQMKKEFQKVIKDIRSDIHSGIDSRRGIAEYPKPMMTLTQMEKRQATVNCGGEWLKPDYEKRLADRVISDERFCAFLEKYGATAVVELDKFGGYQIRIFY